MEPIRNILSKEWPLSKNCIASLRSWQLPKMFSQNEEILQKKELVHQGNELVPPGECLTAGEVGLSNSCQLGTSKSESKVNQDPDSCFQRNEVHHSISLQDNKITPKKEALNNSARNLRNGHMKYENLFSIDPLKAKFELDSLNEMKPGMCVQQTRQFHSKTDKPIDGLTQGISSGVLSKEALLSHHSQRNSSHLAIFDPAMTAINLSALQPSRTGFNVKKLISSSRKELWDWSLPTDNVQIRTEGPSINENLVDFVNQKHKPPIDKRLPVEDKTNTKIRNLIIKAKSMNKEAAKYRMTSTASQSKPEKRLYRTVSKVVIPNKSSIEKPANKQTTEKSFQRKLSTISNGIKSERPSRRNTVIDQQMKNKTDEESSEPSSTAYQPSASYKDVFYNIFNKVSKKPSARVNNLSVFNRTPVEIGNATPKPALKSTLTGVSLNMAARGKSEKHLEAKQAKSQTSISQPSMKDAPRSPFQKTKDSLLSKSAKASFSTATKPKRNIGTIPSRRNQVRNLGTATKPMAIMKGKVVKPYTTGVAKLHKLPKNVNKPKKVIVPLKLKSSFSTNSKIKKSVKLNENPKSVFTSKPEKSLSIKNGAMKIYKPSSRKFSSFHSPKTIPMQANIKQMGIGITENETQPTKSTQKRNVQSRHYSIFEPVQEEVYQELLNLCSSSKHKSAKPTKESMEESCRCSLNEKKEPEKKKGLVCRIANMLNIGCGSDSKCPSPGCTKCEK